MDSHTLPVDEGPSAAPRELILVAYADGRELGRRVLRPEDPELIVGSEASCGLRLEHASVSRKPGDRSAAGGRAGARSRLHQWHRLPGVQARRGAAARGRGAAARQGRAAHRAGRARRRGTARRAGVDLSGVRAGHRHAPQVGADRRHRAARRPDRHRQGRVCARDPREQPAGQEPVRDGRLWLAAPGTVSPAFSEDYRSAREQALEGFERDFAAQTLQRAGGNVSQAARAAGIGRAYLHKLIKRHGLDSGSKR